MKNAPTPQQCRLVGHTETNIHCFVSKGQKWHHYLRESPGAHYDETIYCWNIPKTPDSIALFRLWGLWVDGEPFLHPCLYLYIPYAEVAHTQIRTLTYRRWVKSKKMWEVPDLADVRVSLEELELMRYLHKQKKVPTALPPPPIAHQEMQSRQPELSPTYQDALLFTEERLLVKRYSWRTVKSYLSHLRQFFSYCTREQIENAEKEQIEKYIVERTRAGSYAEATQNQMLNAIKP